MTSTEELFHVVNVGDPSERETLRLYHEAKRHVCVITNSFEYFESVESAFADAHDRVGVDALYLHPDLLSEHKRTKQADVVEYVTTEYPDPEVRFSTDRLSWLGTLIESSIDYNSAEAIFLREESNVSNHIHQAAIT